MKRVLRFYADWCQPCRTLSETLKALAKDEEVCIACSG
jgi:thiol-disulfide isomerase/thioredoxin